MKVFAAALTLTLVLSAGAAYAQAPAQGAPRPAAPAGQTPAQPAPRPATPAAPAAAQPAQPAPVPFQAGLKYAYVRIDQVAAQSARGKAAQDKVKALNDQKVKELQDKNKALQAAQQKLEQGGSVMSDTARAQLQAEIERQQRDLQRFQEDAQQDITQLTQQLQGEFERQLNPIIDRVAREKQVHFIFSAQESGLVWADPTMDLTADIIKAFDATPAAAAPAAAAPAAPAGTQR